MEALLIVVTLGSFVVAAVMSMLAWKVLRGNRRRTAARVEALQALAFDEDEADAADADEGATRAASIAPARPAAARFTSLDDDDHGDPAWMAEPAEDAFDVDDSGDADDLPLVSAPPRPPAVSPRTRPSRVRGRRAAVHAEPMFAAATERGAPPRRWAVLAAIVAVMAAGVGTVYAMRHPGWLPIDRLTLGAAPRTPALQPLELVSLRHMTEPDGAFTITGLVQNPAAGSVHRNVTAIVYLFDRQGQYFSGGHATLEVPVLHGGDASPFVVRIPNATGVSRYRVGFRLADGAVVAHVDRRGSGADGLLDAGATPGAGGGSDPAHLGSPPAPPDAGAGARRSSTRSAPGTASTPAGQPGA